MLLILNAACGKGNRIRRPGVANNEDFNEVISTDVLIVGGGIGGLVAAVKAKEGKLKYPLYRCPGCGKTNLRVGR